MKILDYKKEQKLKKSVLNSDDEMKILVLGASGMAGHTVAIYFKERGYTVTAFSRKPFPFCDWVQGDAFDIIRLKEIITRGNYDAVINCIGLLNQFAESAPEKAIYINS